MRRRALILVCILLVGIPLILPPAVGEPQEKIGIVEKLGGSLPLDAEFYDEAGTLLPLRDLVDRPTILLFVYYRCAGICSPMLTELSRVVDRMGLEPGRDYRIVTISIDHKETPDLAAAKKASYVNSLEEKIDPASWRFLTGDSATIARVTDAAGFYFKPEGLDFIHATGLIIVSPAGIITRYMNGIQQLPFDVKMALIEASEGKVGPTIAKVLAFCYSYDPEGRTYALNITRISLLLILALVVVFVSVFVFTKRKRRTAKGE